MPKNQKNTSKIKSSGQIPLFDEGDVFEKDRNFEKGGRSFYFFDFDDNVVHLPTKILLFHSKSGEEKEISTEDFALHQDSISKDGSLYEGFEISYDPFKGSFRNFRELPKNLLHGQEQPLVRDMMAALQNSYLEWRGPSWGFFDKAVKNNRPISIITARGHHPFTIRRAINILVQSRDLAAHPNYLSIYPVSHDHTRAYLGDTDLSWSTPELKKEAIKVAVNDAFECYGENPYHRFGMSDDDPANVALIAEAMRDMKKEYPDNKFFVFNTHNRQLIREEILVEGSLKESFSPKEQMKLL